MRCNSRITIDQSRIRQLSQAAIIAQEETTEALHTEIVQAQVVPRRDGTLQGESFFVDTSQSSSGRTSLVHTVPYARRLYFHPEYHFHKEPWEETIKHRDGSVSHVMHDGNPNAKGKWFEDWLPGGKNQNFAPDAFKKLYRRNSGV